jgi:hypothetical protein
MSAWRGILQKHFVMRKHANEMDLNLIAKLKIAWRN